MAKKQAPAEAGNDSVADEISKFIGASLGKLVARKNELMKEVSGIDEEIKKITGRVSKQLGRYMPDIPGIVSEIPFPKGPGRPKGSKSAKAGKKTRKPMSDETKEKMRLAAQKRWGTTKKAEGGSGVGNG